jgi:cytochrome c-type biogenesis protein CcmH
VKSQSLVLLKVRVVLVLAAVATGVALAYMAFWGPRSSPSLQDRVDAVASTLGCPVCENLSVSESPSKLARRMRATVESELRQGRSPDEIRANFVRDFGESVLLSPTREGVNLIAWVLPIVLASGAVLTSVIVIRRWVKRGGFSSRVDEWGDDESLRSSPPLEIRR